MALPLKSEDDNSSECILLLSKHSGAKDIVLAVSELAFLDDSFDSVATDHHTTTVSSLQPSNCTSSSMIQARRFGKHAELVLAQWYKLLAVSTSNNVSIDGNGLDLPSVVAVSRYGANATIDKDPAVARKTQDSIDFLQDRLMRGDSIYGITTGFGGSADTRTRSVRALQVGLLQMQLSGTLPRINDIGARAESLFDRALPNENPFHTLSMPEAWVRSAMLIRCNSLVRGHSAVRLAIIEKLAMLLEHNYVPLVPIRGSISASGDLNPHSYIAGALEGNPDVHIWVDGHEGSRILLSADKAMARLGLDPVVFEAKEGLGVLNGTAVSTGVACLALHEANHLAVLSQVLTAMCVEALAGEESSFDPFISRVRPHSGQVEVAQNIRFFLGGSRLIRRDEKHEDGYLRQDRYALRTSSQWVGPQLEDLLLAHSQLATELNSTTDNPLIDVRGAKVHHGGNFQAASVTSSTEKTRSSLQMMGKMIFAQSSELLDVHQNNGLPPNLASDEPSLSYTLKGVDINMAAYMSELAFLANPVGNHVQSAEMGNQAINSLALISARYTHMAVDILSLMSSAHLYSLCQALDLRAMQLLFLDQLKPAIQRINVVTFGTIISETRLDDLNASIWPVILTSLSDTRCKDSSDRFVTVAKSAHTLLLKALFQASESQSISSISNPLALLQLWTTQVAETAKEIFLANRAEYLAHGDASSYLGVASKRMYNFVRKELQVPFHRGLRDHPIAGQHVQNGVKLMTTGSRISIIYEALRSGRLMVPVMRCLEKAMEGKSS